jgi:PAS domain S-box-containing protein
MTVNKDTGPGKWSWLRCGDRSGLELRRPCGIVVLSLCAAALLWGVVLQLLESHRAEVNHAAFQSASNLTRAFEEHIIRSLKSVDQTMHYLRSAYARNPAEFDIAKRLVSSTLLDDDMTAQIFIADAHGIVVASSNGPESLGVDISDRPYFKAHAVSVKDEMSIGMPLIGRGRGTLAIPVSRRITAPDGSFAGVIVAALDPKYLSRFYQSIDLGSDGVVVLVGTDGVVRARASHSDDSSIGHSLIGTPLFRAYSEHKVGNFRSIGLVDGVIRLMGYREVQGFPLLVEVGFSEADVLAPYEKTRSTYLILAGILSVLGLIVAVLVGWRQERLQRTRDQLAASEHKYRSVVDSLNEVVFQADTEMRWTFLNPAWTEIADFTIEESVGRSLVVFVEPRDRSLAREWALRLLSGAADDGRQDIRFIAKDGTFRWLEVHGRTRRDAAGKIIGLSGTLNDVTKRRLAEEALRAARDDAKRATRAKSEFLATMSHEIRSPMHGVLGIIDLLRDTPLAGEQKQMVDLVHESASSLLGILNDILDFSKMEAGAIKIAPEPVALRTLLTAVREAMSLTASAKGLLLELDIDPAIPDYVEADPLRLRQILVNLLGNAIKFTPQGSVRLMVTHEIPEGVPTLVFAVIDTGIGMQPETIDRLFKPFAQADASTTRDYGGTGLGLSISLRLARLMDGDLRASSKPGIGSVLTLFLPSIAAERPSLVAGEDDDADIHDYGGRRVLVAEDMVTNRWLIKRQLERLGLVAETVESGHAAVAALGCQRFDILITDFHMPGMDGIALTRHVRDREALSGQPPLPILGLTADVSEQAWERCRAAGMDGVLAKPTDIGRLDKALRRLLLPCLEGCDEPVGMAEPVPDLAFDDRLYRELFEEDGTDGEDWLAMFVDSAAALLDEIAAHAADDDRPAVISAAHRLAGVALSAGAMRLGTRCRLLEAEAAVLGRHEIETGLIDIRNEFATARAAMPPIRRMESASP